jgi:hypothetical protein
MLCAPLNQHLKKQMMNSAASAFKSKDDDSGFLPCISFDFDNVRYMIKPDK